MNRRWFATVLVTLPGTTLSQPAALESKALALVRLKKYEELRNLLGDGTFLARLDDPATGRTRRLRIILAEMAADADEKTAALGHALAANPAFLSDPDRMALLLELLAAVKPMSRQTVELFRSTNEQGYFGGNALLLAANGSLPARELFQSMMLADSHRVENRIEYLHRALMPRRTEPGMLATAKAILTHTKDERLANGVVESIFDYQRNWFRPSSALPPPPAWSTASREALEAALEVAAMASRRFHIRPELRAVLEREIRVISGVLPGR